MAEWDFDLFGDVVDHSHKGRGRPAHVPTNESRQKCVLLAAVGRSPDEIAAALSITAKTLRKHYSRELRDHAVAKLKVEGKLLVGLVREVDKGNVSANKELNKRIEKAHVQGVSDRIAGRAQPQASAPLGKKEAAKAAAKALTGKYQSRPTPLLN